MTYPTAVVVVAIVVTGILLVKVVPQFAETFPQLRLGPAGLYPVCPDDFEFCAEMVVRHPADDHRRDFCVQGEAKLRSVKFAEFLDRLTLRLPIFGMIVHDSVIARFSRTLATTFAAGVPLVDALESTAGAAGNSVYAKAIRRIRMMSPPAHPVLVDQVHRPVSPCCCR